MSFADYNIDGQVVTCATIVVCAVIRWAWRASASKKCRVTIDGSTTLAIDGKKRSIYGYYDIVVLIPATIIDR